MASIRYEQSLATHKRVLTAADRLFGERGFAATTIRDIANTSDVSVGTVMAVGDKNALLVQVFDSLIEAGHALRRPPTGDSDLCAGQILELVTPFVTLFTGRPNLSRVYASILVSGAHTSALFNKLAELLIAEIQGVVTAHGCATAKLAEATAKTVYFAYIGTLFSWSAGDNADPTELRESLRTTFSAICKCKERTR